MLDPIAQNRKRQALKISRQPDRHQLNESQLYFPIPDKLDQIINVVVDLRQRHAIQLHLLHAERQNFVETLEHSVETISSADLLKDFPVERVQTQIDPVEPRINQLLHHRRQPHSVGRHHHSLNPVEVFDRTDQINDPHSDQRLASRQAHLLDPQPCPQSDHSQNFFVRQDFRMRQLRHARLRHAVSTAKVASIRQRHPHIFDPTIEPIDHSSITSTVMPALKRSVPAGMSTNALQFIIDASDPDA